MALKIIRLIAITPISMAKITYTPGNAMTLYARVMTYGLFAGIVLTVPFWPPMLTIMTGQFKHTRRYLTTIRKGFTHLHALLKTRAVHRYFSGQSETKPERQIPQEIGGFCNRCGACCLERRCMFLEQQSDAEYLCGIYGTWLREHTHCGAYPINQADIDLYKCPTYFVIKPGAISGSKKTSDSPAVTLGQ